MFKAQVELLSVMAAHADNLNDMAFASLMRYWSEECTCSSRCLATVLHRKTFDEAMAIAKEARSQARPESRFLNGL